MNITAAYNQQKNTVFGFDIWSDELLAIWVPIAVYWIQCTNFEILMRLKIPYFEKYRIHSPEDRERRNKVSFGKVLIMVALQHVVQIVLGVALLKNMDAASVQLKYQQQVAKYSGFIMDLLLKLGQPMDSSAIISRNIAIFIQNYIVPAIQFFLGM